MQTSISKVGELLSTYHDYGFLDGAVLVGRGDEVLFQASFGHADLTWAVPNTPDTKFRIGSVTKQFTAALVLQLAEEGRIDLDAPVTRYVTDYPAAQGERVTIRHLLTHTSGIPSYTSLPNFDSFTRDPFKPDAFLAVFSGLDLEFEPGSRFDYSNSGYHLLGVVIERVAGKPYAAVLRDRLLKPLGLHNSGYDTYTDVVQGLATGYTRTALGYERAAYLDPSVPYAAGMMYATVMDLFRWTRALHRGEPFRDNAALAQMTTPFLDGYGFGLAVYDMLVGERSIQVVDHGGGINSFSAQLRYLPEEALTVVVLDNAEGDTEAVADALTLLFCGQPVEAPKRSVQHVLSAVVEAEGWEVAEARYQTLKAEEPDAYDFGEAQLNALGYAYLGRGGADTAVRVLALNAEVYPDSSNAHDSLAEAYLAAGDRAGAVATYERALALNPASTSTEAALEQLGVGEP